MNDAREKSRQDDLLPQHMPQQPGNFFSFRYSRTEIWSQDGNLHLKRSDTRYRDGRLVSEECEGMLEQQAYERMMLEAQNHFIGRFSAVLRMLSGWR